jgi:aryl-alcohol dehydrogenase-like predicted oxidoreductase
MEYRNLGRTGVKVSELCLGCMTFDGRTPEDEAQQIVDRALDAGINFLDTANIYGKGVAEEVLGRVLAKTGKRDRIVLATKVHGPMEDVDPNKRGNSRRHIIEQCEESLKRLQTDWIDLYQVHRPQPDVPIDETLRALDDLIRAGKVRYIGTSTFGAWQIVEALWAAKELGLNRFVCDQSPYNLLDRRVERELIPMAQTYGMGVISWSPQGRGFLSGKYKRNEPLPEGARLEAGHWKTDHHLVPEAWDVVETVVAMAGEKGCTPSQLALAWVRTRPGVTAPIMGPRTLEQFEDNLGSLEVSITPEDEERLDAVSKPGRMVVPYYEANFGPHTYRWG